MRMLRWTVMLLLALGTWSQVGGQTRVDLSRQGKLGSGNDLPAQCTVGQLFIKTDALSGSNLYVCMPTGWTMLGQTVFGGDVAGSQQSLTVQGIQGRVVNPAAPADQNVMRWNATSAQWEPGSVLATGAALPPGACATGTLYLLNDPARQLQQLYLCSNTDSWSMASFRSDAAMNRPVDCVAGQIWLSTDTGVMTYCSAAGAWNTLAGGSGSASSNFTTSTALAPAFSPTPTFSLADVSLKSPVRVEPACLTANVTSVTFTNTTPGAKFSIAWCQTATGGFTVTYGASAVDTCAIDPTPGMTTTQFFEIAADGATVKGVGCIGNNSTPPVPELAAPQTPAAGTGICWFDSTNHIRSCQENGSPTVSVTVVPDAGDADNFLTGIGPDGVPKKAQPVCANLSNSSIGCSATFGANAQAATYQVLASDFDNHKTITVASGTFTITLVASGSQPGNGKKISIINYGAGSVTIARSGQYINGGTAGLILPPGSATAPTAAEIISDGTNYFASLSGTPGSGASGGSAFTGSTASVSAFSATPTFSLADVNVKSPTRFEPSELTANVTAVTFTNKSAGAKFSIAWTQASSGGPYAVTYGSVTNPCPVDTTAGSITTHFFEVAADGTTVNGVGCASNTPGLKIPGSASGLSTILAPAAGGGASTLPPGDGTLVYTTQAVADPGSNGFPVRTGAGSATARTINGAPSKVTVTNGDGVGGNPTITIGSDVVDKTGSTTYTAGARQTFVPSSSAAGIGVLCAALPSSPATGDQACDSADGNKMKWWNGGQWLAMGASSTGIGDPGADGILYRFASGTTRPASAGDVSATAYADGGGTAQAQTLTLPVPITSLTTGLRVCWLPAAANTAAAPTLAVNGLSAKPITKYGVAALTANDITSSAVACAIYDGAGFQLQNPQTVSAGASLATRSIGMHFDGAGSPLSGQQTNCFYVPYSGTITGWHVDAQAAGNATFAIRTIALASYTGIAGFSGYMDIAGGGATPTISGTASASSSNLTNWATTFSAGQEWCFQLNNPSVFTWVNVILDVTSF